MSDKLTRRDFVDRSSKLAMGAMIVPRPVLGGPGYQAPSDRLNLAIIGVGGQGTGNAQEFGTEHISAICDVDFGVVHRRVQERLTDGDGNPREKGHRWREQFLQARQYTDFRELLDREADLDAVLIATPDHLHAPIAKAAMEAGKHVYVEKPLTYTVHEARALNEIAERTGVVTQMGNQGHSEDGARLINEWVAAGVLGDVTEVHIWTNRPIWPQGFQRPTRWDGGLNPGWYQQWNRGAILSMTADVMDAGYPVPKGMNWDMYLGPTTKEIPYHPVYHPFNWRGWVDFGVSALGDMGAHLVDHPYWALGLTYPTTIEATSSPWGGPSEDPASYPQAMRAHYEFPARGDMPPVDMHWYDGGFMPSRPQIAARRRASQPRRRRHVHRRTRDPHARYVRPEPQAVPRIADRRGRGRAADLPAHRGHPPDELGEGLQGGRGGVEPLRLRVAANGGDAAGCRRAAGRPGTEDLLRCGCHANHQHRRGEQLPDARVSRGLAGLNKGLQPVSINLR